MIYHHVHKSEVSHYVVKRGKNKNQKLRNLFFEITQNNSITHNAHTLTSTNERKLYPCKHLRRLNRQIIEIDEVTVGASLSTVTSVTTKSTVSNPESKMLPKLL